MGLKPFFKKYYQRRTNMTQHNATQHMGGFTASFSHLPYLRLA